MRALFQYALCLLLVSTLVLTEEEDDEYGSEDEGVERQINVAYCRSCIDNCMAVGNTLQYCEVTRCQSICIEQNDESPDSDEDGDGKPDDGKPNDGKPNDGKPDDGKPEATCGC